VTWLLELYVEDLVAKVANMNVKGGMGNFKTGGGGGYSGDHSYRLPDGKC